MTAADYRRISHAIGVLRGAGRRLPEIERQMIGLACRTIERVLLHGAGESPRPADLEPPPSDSALATLRSRIPA